MTIQYIQSGEYYIPNLSLPEGNYTIGKYGRMRKRYLKDHRPILFTNMILSGELYPHLTEINTACVERMERIVQQMKAQEDVTEALKADNQMEWVRRMNSIQNRAEEIVLREIVFC